MNCRKCGKPIAPDAYMFGSAETEWEHMEGECPQPYVHPQPDDTDVQWIVRHRRMTDELIFGPFATAEDAEEWCLRNNVQSMATPLIPPRVEAGGYNALWRGWR